MIQAGGNQTTLFNILCTCIETTLNIRRKEYFNLPHASTNNQNDEYGLRDVILPRYCLFFLSFKVKISFMYKINQFLMLNIFQLKKP